MQMGDLVKWTWAESSNTFNKNKFWYYAILIKEEVNPSGNWVILLETGELALAFVGELEVINDKI